MKVLFQSKIVASAALFCMIQSFAGVGWSQDDPDRPVAKKTPFGVNYVPAHIPDSTEEDARQALLEALTLGSHVSYIWEWSSGEKGYNDAVLLAIAASALNLKLVLQMSPSAIGGPTVPPDLTETSFHDPTVRARFIQDAERFAHLQPDYLILATEINLAYEVNRHEFEGFRTLYAQAYEAVKRIAPKAKVGVSFHMDMLFAMNQLRILEIMGKQDFVALTSYPNWLVANEYYGSVADIPLWYYKRLRLIIRKPIIFSELAWPTGGRSNIDLQEQFVARLPELMRGVEPELITWAMQHDVRHFQTKYLTQEQIQVLLGFKVDAQELFDELNTMGLLSWDGPPKPAWFRALEYPSH